MKTKEKNTKKTFDAVKFMREQKDKISKDLKGKSFTEIKKYLKESSSKLQAE